MSDDLDRLAALPAGNLAALLDRAADWRTRLRGVTPDTAKADVPPHARPLLLLPPELMGIGQVAATLAAEAGIALSLARADVMLQQEPAAILAHLTDAGLLTLLSGPNRAITPAQLAAGAWRTLPIPADPHPVAALDTILQAVAAPPLRMAPLPTELADFLDSCRPDVPTAHNPAKQLALRIAERVAIFLADDPILGVAQDWAARLQWRAECVAWSLHAHDLARLAVLARLPRYWPNTACLVPFDGGSAEHSPLSAALSLMQRRRFAVAPVATPAVSDLAQRVAMLLELGEWVALYVATLNNSDPGRRVPHEILFSP